MSAQLGDPRTGKRWSRSYPPLILLALAVLAVVIVLPSSLNLPQSNPTTVLEYAPVPPQDDNPPPVTGNLSTLGLGQSRTLAAGGLPPPQPPPVAIQGIGGRPRQKACVGSPPRQTEDPSSPPCVPFFQGDNFGSTWQGVTKDEITVLVYFDVGNYGLSTNTSETTPPPGTYVNIDEPRLPNCAGYAVYSDPAQCDHMLVRILKGFSHYFTDRFQTYSRRVHYWAYFTGANSEAERRSDAITNWDKLHPFAVVDEGVFNGFNQEYDTAMTELSALTFASSQGSLPNEFYRKNAPKSWGFFPDVEHWSDLYSSYVCKKVAPYSVRRFGLSPGSGAPNGTKRRFALWHTTDPAQPGLQLFADLVKQKLARCGVVPVSDATYSKSGFAIDGTDTGTEAAQAVAKFQDDDVTTLLHIGGAESKFSESAAAVRYYPEIVVAGNLDTDNNYFGQVQNQDVWQNAWAVTFQLRINRLHDSPGYRAYKEGDPSGDDAAGFYAQIFYRDHFMLFQGIQVAGPRLSPQSIDSGFHAIPERQSSDPYSAALFFDPGDYTSVKDSAEEWWDPRGQSPPGGQPSNRPGCYRMVREGRRFLSGRWAGADDVFRQATDPCTGYGGTIGERA
jgi:hypothetical protein